MSLKHLKILLLALIVLSGNLFTAQSAQKNKTQLFKFSQNDPAYLFAYFTGDGNDGLHLMYSMDGLIWRTLNNGKSFLTPTVGENKLMRDPSIMQDAKGIFHMVWTTGWTDKGIGYASSPDLIHWSEQQNIPVMENEPTAKNAWAPELYHDKLSGVYYIVWASTIPGRFAGDEKGDDSYNHRLYYVTTQDFKNFSKTKLFYDPGFNVIDACFLKRKGAFYMFLKNETKEPAEKNIRVVSGSSIKRFSKTISEPISGKKWAEGPTAIQIGKYTYVYFDYYRNQQYGAVRCKNLRKPVWEDVTPSISFPTGVRHGTAFKVNNDVLINLQKLEEKNEQ
jgi:hypothetical protein